MVAYPMLATIRAHHHHCLDWHRDGRSTLKHLILWKASGNLNISMAGRPKPLPLSIMIVVLWVFVGRCHGNGVIGAGGVISGGDTFFPDWGLNGGRSAQPTCLDIPRNLSLCHGIRYSKMRLPNLLDHDSMAEVIQQAASWVPLLNVRCHADTQLFLCSLFRYTF